MTNQEFQAAWDAAEKERWPDVIYDGSHDEYDERSRLIEKLWDGFKDWLNRVTRLPRR